MKTGSDQLPVNTTMTSQAINMVEFTIYNATSDKLGEAQFCIAWMGKSQHLPIQYTA